MNKLCKAWPVCAYSFATDDVIAASGMSGLQAELKTKQERRKAHSRGPRCPRACSERLTRPPAPRGEQARHAQAKDHGGGQDGHLVASCSRGVRARGRGPSVPVRDAVAVGEPVSAGDAVALLVCDGKRAAVSIPAPIADERGGAH